METVSLLGKAELSEAELRHCLRQARRNAQQEYSEARKRASEYGNDFSSESSVDAMWRGRVDRWQPSPQLRAWVVRREVQSALAIIKTAWRSDAHRGAANFLTREKEEEQVDAAWDCRGRLVGVPLMSTKPKGRARPRSPSVGPAAASGSKQRTQRRRSSSSRRSRRGIPRDFATSGSEVD
jgi:hypothetical protein